MSNLDKDIARAAALGMSYGRYKQAYPGEPVVKPKPVEVKEAANAVCGICGKPFHKGRGNQKYCGYECSYEAIYRRSRAEYQRKSPPKNEQTCPCCGIVFIPKTRAGRFCSDKCRRQNEIEKKRMKRLQEAKK